MKNRAILLLFICLYFIVVNSFSESRLLRDQDGNDWIRANEWLKLGLISGIIMGVSLAVDYKPEIDILKFIREVKHNSSLLLKTLDLKYYFNHLDKIPLFNITVGQLKDGLDAFYKDFSVRRIKIIDAVYIVKMQIEGNDPDLINAQILYLKRQPISEEKTRKAWERYFDFEKVHSRYPEYKDIIKGEFSKEDLLIIGKFISSNNKEHELFCFGKYK